MNRKIKIRGKLRHYMQITVTLGVLLTAMTICQFFVGWKAGSISLGFTLLYWLIVMLVMFYDKPRMINDLINFATNYGQVQRQLLYDFAIPYALLDRNGQFVWFNYEFQKAVNNEKLNGKTIYGAFKSISKEQFLGDDEQVREMDIQIQDRDYHMKMSRVILDDLMNDNSMLETVQGCDSLIAVYLFDVTQINYYMRENQEQKLVAGLINLDNYDEALETVEEVRRSLLIALVDRKVNKYFNDLDGIVRKIEKDKYFVVLKRRELEEMKEDKCSILEDVKKINIGNEIPVTLSIGIGAEGKSYLQNYSYARAAIDLALARGGDQAVIKTNKKNDYYGGKGKQVEKNTRVKARVKAQALREIMESKDKVFVMGHSMADLDSFGASVGIFKAAAAINKKAYIVINDISSAVRPMIANFLGNKEYPEDMFLDSGQAMEKVDGSSMLVVVDVNKPSITDCRELLKIVKTVVVFDHHRQGDESISNAVLSYVEPYASSTCEMVAEILQYFNEGVKIRNLEADCLYAGILIDTNNFMSKAGVRTFEAAAFLRRCGADVARVRKMYREDIITYKAKAAIIRNAQVVEGAYAIAVCENQEVENITILAAQTANELLNISGITASFVLSYYQGKVYISARSIDEVNVQVIMEKLGGGGHQNMAGVQLEGYSLEEAADLLKSKIRSMIKEGEL